MDPVYPQLVCSFFPTIMLQGSGIDRMSAMMGSKIALSLHICILAFFMLAGLASMVAGTELAHLPVTDRSGSPQSGSVNQCRYDFSKLDFSSVTSVCKGPDYKAKLCCHPFSKLACSYKPEINDFNSLCPIYFLSYLNVAGGYPAGVFVGDGRCNSGNNLCSA